MHIFIGELIGTLLLVLLGNGVVANVLLTKSKGFQSGWIVIATGWGFAVAIGVYASSWMSGGHLNPAVTLGLILAHKTPLGLLPFYLLGQLLGALLGAVLVWLTYFPHFKATKDSHMKLLCFATSPAIKNPVWNFTTEVIATAVLILGVLALFDTHNGMTSEFGPYAVGILVLSIGLSLGGPTGYAINPVRDLAPRIIHSLIIGKGSSEWSYAWIPVIAPCIGALLGTALYLFYSSL